MIYQFRCEKQEADETVMMGDSGISVRRRSILRNGEPWIPVSGEFHFSRYDSAQWELELQKMKAGGITVVSTYLFWIYHEELQGEFDFSGNYNLRRFIELCGEIGLCVVVRLGPWAHGECRNGGFPDWLAAKCVPRTDDAAYLSFVQLYWSRLAKQLEGLYWSNGGAVIGLQIENELTNGESHLLTLKRLAVSLGMTAPIYTATGWGGGSGAALPYPELLPTFGGYPDHPWEQNLLPLHPGWKYFFVPMRNDSGIGSDLRKPIQTAVTEPYPCPYLTCEVGPGVQVTQHRRPVIAADDAAALALCKIGSGVNWLGYYMYHGGSNPVGGRSTFQESKETGYPNDLPVISYDFQAPLSAAGQARESFYSLKLLNYFLTDFGSILSPMAMTLPSLQPTDSFDTQTVRAAVRTGDEGGFLFVNNYQRGTVLSAKETVQFQIDLPQGRTVIPNKPVTIPSNTYFIFPFQLQLGSVRMEYATVQLVCREQLHWYAFVPQGMQGELVFSSHGLNGLTLSGGTAHTEEGKTVVTVDDASPAPCEIKLIDSSGREFVLTVLTQSQAKYLWKTKQGVCCRDDVEVLTDAGGIAVHSLTAKIEWHPISADFSPAYERFLFAKTSNGIQAWECEITGALLEPGERVLLQLDYTGDVGQLYRGEQLISDWFQNGVCWTTDITPYLRQNGAARFRIKISPWDLQQEIYLEEDSLRFEQVSIRGISLIKHHVKE